MRCNQACIVSGDRPLWQLEVGLESMPEIRAEELHRVCSQIKRIWDLLQKDKKGRISIDDLMTDLKARSRPVVIHA